MYSLLRKTLRLFFHPPLITGLKEVRSSGPCVFAANHQGSYGPLILMLYLPFRLYPWVTGELTTVSRSPEYIRKDFIETELRIHGPVSVLLSWITGYLAVQIMHIVQAVPVFKKSKKITRTISKSMDLLLEGGRLLIFPEIPGTDSFTGIGQFDTGFLKLTEKYRAATGEDLPVYPVSVNKEQRHIVISKPVLLSTRVTYSSGRNEMIANIVESVYHGIRIPRTPEG